MMDKLPYSVLYVEDDDAIRDSFTMLLKRLVEKVFVTENGLKGLESFKSNRQNIVISDITMPEMSGLEMARGIREVDSEVPILFTTAHSDSEFFLKSIELRIDGYLIKPVHRKDLLKQLDNISAKLENSSLKKSIEENHKYTQSQQQQAKKKQLSIIENDLIDSDEFSVDTIYESADILSGDAYSIYQREDGSVVLFLIDGQGHGINPSLTVFATSSAFKHALEFSENLEVLINKVVGSITDIVLDNEQLSFTVIEISPQRDALTYASGGMYPFFILDGEKIVESTTNNLPIMDFTEEIFVATIKLEDFQGLAVFSDGLVEDLRLENTQVVPEKLLEESNYLSFIKEEIAGSEKLFDDISVVLIKRAL